MLTTLVERVKHRQVKEISNEEVFYLGAVNFNRDVNLDDWKKWRDGRLFIFVFECMLLLEDLHVHVE
jgi:tRNA G26 N,N-dimethylase Trm1